MPVRDFEAQVPLVAQSIAALLDNAESKSFQVTGCCASFCPRAKTCQSYTQRALNTIAIA
jgi:hypothetical protein